jgi:predicted nucleic acid-binding protein
MLSYYDAQIWAIARLGQMGVVLSEDFNPGTVLDGVSFTNPLDPEFDLAALG